LQVNPNKENIIWFRDELMFESDANVNVLSGMAQFGLNVFEGIRCYRSANDDTLYAFRLHDHLKRLEDSCKLLSLSCPAALEVFEQNFYRTILANNFTGDVAVRLTVLVDGTGSWSSVEPVSYFIAPISKPRIQLSKLKGLTACISSWKRISDNAMPPRAKVGANYINGRFAHMQARYDGYDLPVFLDDNGYVSEGAGACIMFLKNRKLITPSNTSSILDSITRNTILALAKDMNIDVEERSVDKSELYLADEVFMCGTAAEITPVIRIDKFQIGKGVVGEFSRRILSEYHKLVSGENALHFNWLAEVKG
jgi:branched-chain amino acid aminotransferase